MKKKMHLLTLLSVMFLILTSYANEIEISNVSGNISSGDKAIEGATVKLLAATDSSAIKTTFSDRSGSFHFQEQREGKYLVSVQFVGFATYYSEVFELNEETFFYQLRPVKLAIASQQLNAVTVTSKKPFIEQKIDKTVVNVDASPTNTGLTALEVLEKSPGVTVDKDGNVSLKGKQGVLILIDGKPTYLGSADLANMLRNMASSNIDQLEIMTNPPAKYDASGNSGIINIKTKKSKIKGLNGSVTAGAGMGQEPKANESFSLNYRSGKVNVFGNYSYNWNKGIQQLDLNRNFRNAQTGDIESVFSEHSDMQNN